MNKITILLCMALPLSAWSQDQPYTIKFTDLKAPGDNSAKDKILKGAALTTATVDKATVTIKGVLPGEESNIKLVFKDEPANLITEKSVVTADSTVIFNVGNNIRLAKGKFLLLYKENPNGTFIFEVNDNQKPPGDENELTTYLAALANANFIGNNKFLSNLTPVVNLGGIIDLKNKKFNNNTGIFTWRLDINPYIGAQIDTKDSVSFIPAMMLGGRAGIGLNNYLSWGDEKVTFTWMPLGFGLKIIPDLKDSATNIWQHNFRTGVSLKYQDIFILGAQFTYGFHNTTSESKIFYQKVFSKSSKEIQYLTISGQFYVKSRDEEKRSNYLYIEWRGLLNKKAYEPFTNNTIITIGFRKDLKLTNTFATAVADRGNPKKLSDKKPPAIF
jgi:hypothetical protein